MIDNLRNDVAEIIDKLKSEKLELEIIVRICDSSDEKLRVLNSLVKNADELIYFDNPILSQLKKKDYKTINNLTQKIEGINNSIVGWENIRDSIA